MTVIPQGYPLYAYKYNDGGGPEDVFVVVAWSVPASTGALIPMIVPLDDPSTGPRSYSGQLSFYTKI